MRRLSIALFAVLLLSPALCRAQYADDSQNPKEYTQEDSNPLKFIFYILSPLGYALEWGVARPLHYMVTQSSVAPMFGSGDTDPVFGDSRFAAVMGGLPAPIAEMPPGQAEAAPAPGSGRSSVPLQEESVGPPAASTAAPSTRSQPSVPPASSSTTTGQPILH